MLELLLSAVCGSEYMYLYISTILCRRCRWASPSIFETKTVSARYKQGAKRVSLFICTSSQRSSIWMQLKLCWWKKLITFVVDDMVFGRKLIKKNKACGLRVSLVKYLTELMVSCAYSFLVNDVMALCWASVASDNVKSIDKNEEYRR